MRTGDEWHHWDAQRMSYSSHYHARRRYGCLNFLLDAFLTVITHGLWLIWIFVREVRR